MKRAAILLAAALCLAPSAHWRKVATTRQAVYYADDERTDRDSREVGVWEKIEPLDTDEGREYLRGLRDELKGRGTRTPERLAYVTARRRYRCAEGRAAFEQVLYHAAGGEVIARDPDERLNKWESPAPDSIGEKMMLDACRQPAKYH